jgi:hypothetical protein
MPGDNNSKLQMKITCDTNVIGYSDALVDESTNPPTISMKSKGAC